MLITNKLSKDIERCVLQSHLNCAQRYQALGDTGDSFHVGSGAAIFLGAESFLTQVVAWGFDANKSQLHTQLDAIENFYKERKHSQVDIELSPLTGSIALNLLTQRGYQPTEFSNISTLDLSNFDLHDKAIIEATELTPESMLDAWANAVASGFECIGAKQQFLRYALSENISAFHVSHNDEIAAGATVAIHNNIADLGVTSTLPNYRGKGFQKQLLLARLYFAKQNNAEFAIVTTEPGSISDNNVQKLGFHCAYTRIKFTKALN